ncbi:DNA-binding protein [Acidiferrobacter thiooxydans]|nr:DNA-binding protein [Acidiferrobacter thiooxydans]UEN99704.1 DNA-binding protein [Acidiferrobacter thiooxydans]
MSRTGITQDQVFAAAQALADRAQPVTVQALREALGHGSFTTLSQHLRAWKSHIPTHPLPPLPPEIEAAAHQALARVWTAASELAQQEVQAVRSAAHTQIAESQMQAQETLQEIAHLERTVQDQEGRIATLKPALATAETHLAAHAAKITQLEARIAELKAELEAAQLHNDQRAEECGRLRGELAVYAALAPSDQTKKPGRSPSARPDLPNTHTQGAKTIDGL